MKDEDGCRGTAIGVAIVAFMFIMWGAVEILKLF